MNDFFASLIRTYVPIAVAAVVTWLANVGVVLPDDASVQLSSFLGGLAGALYYTVVRWLEQRHPALGKLLGVDKQPTYDTPAAGVEH